MRFFIFCLLSLCICSCTSLSTRYNQGFLKLPTQEMAARSFIRAEVGMHLAPIRKIVADDGKKYLVTASLDKTVRIWKLETGQLLTTLRTPILQGSEGKIYAVAISPNGETIALAGWTGLTWERAVSIFIFDTNNGRLIYRITDLPNVVHHLTYSKTGTFLIAALGGKNGIYVYQTVDYSLVSQDRYYNGPVYDAKFSSTGKLVTASYDGFLRLYNRDFQLQLKQKTRGGTRPYSIAFSPEGLEFAVAFADTSQIDILATKNLSYKYSLNTDNINLGALNIVCWGVDGSLYAGGSYRDQKTRRRFIRRWYNGGKGTFQDIGISKDDILSLSPLPDGSIAFASADPAFGILYENNLLLNKLSPVIDYSDPQAKFELSPNGYTIRFCYGPRNLYPRYFSLLQMYESESALTKKQPKDSRGSYIPTFTTLTFGLPVNDWKNSNKPRLQSKILPLKANEYSRSLAIANDKKNFVLGTDLFLRCFDREGKAKWKTAIPATAERVNISRNGLILTAGLNDGTIRWYGMHDGREKITFFPHADRKRWIAWTPTNFYAASLDGTDLARLHKNKSIEAAPDALPLSPTFRKPDALARAMGVQNQEVVATIPEKKEQNGQAPIFLEYVDPSRLDKYKDNTKTKDTQTKIAKQSANSSKLPNLYLLAVGVSKYQNPKWKLDFAAKDAKDFSQTMSAQQGLLYGNLYSRIITDQQATRVEILKALDWIKNSAGSKDMAMIFLAGHGENDANGFYYFLPVNFSPKNLALTAISFAKIQEIVASLRGKSVFFVDTCRSGGILSGRRIDIDNSIAKLAKSKNKKLVILASSSGRQLSFENFEWQNGAFTKALLEGINGKSDLFQTGEITISGLYLYISNRVKQLTNGKQTPTIAIPNNSVDFPIAKVKKNK